MATLTDNQCAKIRQELHKHGLDLLQAESTPLTKTQIKDALQAIEDYWENNRTSIKSDIDTAVGTTIGSALAKRLGKFWLKLKWELE